MRGFRDCYERTSVREKLPYPELPDDSGNWPYIAELPDDSGEELPPELNLPDDSGEF